MTPATLKEARAALGMTQRDLAEKMRVTSSTVHKWEQGVHPIPEWVDAFMEMMG